ncbi:Unknown protein [Striga hermonthica]|uniref:Uncharacterized protein n=1 Tax=Striga hermonthica TaxID=68872 RepID=A0A9N7N382_STRHE|nr:Unknown protein [Striga hermonthica]
MGNTSLIRCCLACILPCGALDLIRVVHLNGYVEELTGRVTAGEVLKSHPSHVLTSPCSQGAMARRILIVSPGTELKRGSIYFLVPESLLHGHEKVGTKKKGGSKLPRVAEKNEPRSLRRRKVAADEWRPRLESILEDF